MVVTSFMGGLMLVAIAFLGEYVWRILDEVRARRRSSRHAMKQRREPASTAAARNIDREVVQQP